MNSAGFPAPWIISIVEEHNKWLTGIADDFPGLFLTTCEPALISRDRKWPRVDRAAKQE